MMKDIVLPAEWEAQEFVQLVFPHKDTDWVEYLDDAIATFVNIAKTIAKYQKCLIVAKNLQYIKSLFKVHKNLTFVRLDSDDTWSRDFGGITIKDGKSLKILDFKFNGWGGKYPSKKDNKITTQLKLKGIFKGYKHQSIPFILEGGAIDSDGDGVLLTTSQCLLNKNRNKVLSKNTIEKYLFEFFGLDKILWLDYGSLVGDDTDSHIDTLARFISTDTIVYQSCDDENNPNFAPLQKMYNQLKTFKTKKGLNYKLVALPSIGPKYYQGEQLPATYVNFLIINGAVLVPIYNDTNDTKALEIFKKLFPKRDIISIDCLTLIKQHGSLHCVTIQYPKLKI